ncbi:MAG: glycosyltransferase family 2 protein [Waterburya sp.]
MPKISVIIPAYNAEKTISRTIESVQKQTFGDFELIIINDGSIDRTAEIVQNIKDLRLKLFSYENGGVSVARNRGIHNASGDYLAFLDADDLWTNDKLEKQLAALEANPEAGVAYSLTSYIDEQDNLLYRCNPVSFEGNVLKQLLLTNFLINGSNPLIRQQAIKSIGKFDPSLKSSEDWDYYLRLAASYPFVSVPKYQILYRKSSTNMSSNVERMKKTSCIVLERAYQNAPPNMQYLGNQSFSILYLYCAELYLYNSQINRQDINKVGENLWLSIRLRPHSLLEINTQRLLIKFLLIKLLPINGTNFILHFFSFNRYFRNSKKS